MDVLAHQGGWDEILFVATPVAVFAGLLWLARTRADRELDDDERGQGRPAEDGVAPRDDA